MSETLIPLLDLTTKLLMYLGMAAFLGGLFISILCKEQPALFRFIKRYMLVGTLLALSAVGANFYAQVGSFAESGWEGMFDAMYVNMLWDSSVGESLILRFTVLCIILLLLLLSRHKLTLSLVMIGLSVLLAASFSLIGHTAELSLILRALLGIHVLIALLWIGSLLPLWQACRGSLAIPSLQRLMHQFGLMAMGLVSVLLVCGVILAYQLLGSINELISTPYGLMLLAKVVLVGGILGFAAWHKWRLVPQLTDQPAASRLQRSILLESILGLAILIVTVLLTTVVGPASMSE
ncbi:MAG: copper resistance D family protein [Thiolinea sp.]